MIPIDPHAYSGSIASPPSPHSLTSIVVAPLWIIVFLSLLFQKRLTSTTYTSSPPTSASQSSSSSSSSSSVHQHLLFPGICHVATLSSFLLLSFSLLTPYLLSPTTSPSSSLSTSPSFSFTGASSTTTTIRATSRTRTRAPQRRRAVSDPLQLALVARQGAIPSVPPVVGPSPTPVPTPSAVPSSSASPTPVLTVPAPAPVDPQPPGPTPGPGPQQQSLGRPSRAQCSAGLRRMLAVLLLELCFEFLFLFIRCFADQTLVNPPARGETRSVDITFRGYLFVRAIYAIPVVILNCAIYWIGGGPNGACLTAYGEIQIAFAHLIFYLLYCVFAVVIGIYRIELYDEKENASYSYSPSRTRTNEGTSPPDRTESYFHSSRRRRPATESSYEQPKFRFNFGCFAINF